MPSDISNILIKRIFIMDASIKTTGANPFDFAAIKTFDISKFAPSSITLCCCRRESIFYVIIPIKASIPHTSPLISYEFLNKKPSITLINSLHTKVMSFTYSYLPLSCGTVTSADASASLPEASVAL